MRNQGAYRHQQITRGFHEHTSTKKQTVNQTGEIKRNGKNAQVTFFKVFVDCLETQLTSLLKSEIGLDLPLMITR